MALSKSTNITRWLKASPCQLLAFLFCFLFGAAMVANIQLEGDAEWFWYATLLHHGVRLYADLHFPLQPLFPLEVSGWMQLVGKSNLAYQSLSLVHIFLFCLVTLLLLRESRWPDWRKAIIFLAVFVVDIFFVAIRFDDFHIVSDTLCLAILFALLRVYHAEESNRGLLWSGFTGVLAGLCFTNRPTEGAMMILTAGFCIPFLARQRKFIGLLVYLLGLAAAILAIVHLSGDTIHDYLVNSIFHAASAKGGTGTVFHGPLIALKVTFTSIWHNKGSGWFLVPLIAGAVAQRFGKASSRSIFAAELLGIACIAVLISRLPSMHQDLTNGAFIASFNVILQNLVYPLCLYVLYRVFRSSLVSSERNQSASSWDSREVLVLFAGAILVSAAASQATGSSNNTFSLTLLLLLSTLWLPLEGRFRWLTDTWIVIALVMFASGTIYKVRIPYAWNTYSYKPMFEDRRWYHHPVYGPLYIQSETLQYFQSVCDQVDTAGPPPELLSIPYPYANYFCATPPWKNYVQTWFDTVTPQTIQTLMQQLDQAPPQWILYQRQIFVLHAHELEYNHGQPIIERQLDTMIMDRISSGKWKLIQRSDYHSADGLGDGWFLIETRP